MNIMTKRGNQDNMVTYEHICDTVDDLENINPEYVTLGSVAIVLKGEAGMETYMATSDKEWIPLALSGSTAAGGISLPEVTTADNGKVLGVVEGEWNKIATNGGSGMLVCHEDETTGALDHTYKEIADAGFAILFKDVETMTFVGTLQYWGQPSVETYGVGFYINGHYNNYIASAENEYPVIVENPK